MPRQKDKTPIVAILNMKGGVGKTTIAGNLFREVFRRKEIKTLLIDLDAQFNLTQLLMTRAKYETLLDDKKTIFSIFQHEVPDSVFAVSEDYLLELPPVKDVVTTLKVMSTDHNIKLQLLPGDFRLAMLNLKERAELRIPKKRFKKFIEQAKNNYQLIVIDCNPSTSFLTGCALEAASHILIPVRSDKYSVLGVEMVHEYAEIHLGEGLIPDIKILLNDVQQNDGLLEVASRLRGHPTFGPNVLVNELKHTELLRAKSDYTGFAIDQQVPYRETVRRNLVAIADEYASYLGV